MTVSRVFSFEGDTCVRVHETYDRDEAMRWVEQEGTEPAEGIWFVLGRRLTPESHAARFTMPGDGVGPRRPNGRN